GRIAQNNDYFRLDYGDLSQQKWLAHLGFFGSRRSIPGGPAPVYISNQYLFSFEPDSFDDLCQQLAGSAHERTCLRVFISSRRLSDKHQARLTVALSVDNVCSLLKERATSTVPNAGPNLLKGLSRFGQLLAGRGKICK